ncbi:MAG: hypothetical protein ACREDZ_16620 [Kiloniellales bacterium]
MLLVLRAEPSEAEGLRIEIARADCDALAIHYPNADVAYRPGVDVQGRPVTPADLDSSPLRLPEVIVIPIEVDLFERFGLPPDPTRYDADAEIGTVVWHDGRLYFDGQPIHDEAAAELAARCQRQGATQP